MPEQRSLIKNGLYNSLAGIIRIGVNLITVPILIRSIGIEDYGLWTLASAVIGILALSEAGLSTSTTVFVSQDLAQQDVKGLSETITITVGSIISIATLTAILLFLSSDIIASLFPKLSAAQQQTYADTLRIGSFVIWARLIQQVLVGIEQAYQRYDLLVVLNTISSLCLNLGMLMIVIAGGLTLNLMQWQAFISLAILSIHIITVFSLNKDKHLHLIWNQKKAKNIASYSSINWFSLIGSAIFSTGDRLVLGNILGATSIGVYSAICNTTSQINVLSALPVQPIVPYLSKKLSKERKKQDNIEITKKLLDAFRINIFISLGLAVTFITLSSWIIKFLFPGTNNLNYIYFFQIASGIYGLYSINILGYYILLSTKQIKKCAAITIASGITSLILIAIGATKIGLLGAILGNSGYLLNFLLIFWGVKQVSIKRIQFLNCLKMPIFVFFINLGLNFYIFKDVFVWKVAILALSIISLILVIIIDRNKHHHPS